MKRYVSVFFIVGVMAVLSMLSVVDKEKQEPLATAMLAAGAKTERISIHGWGKLPQEDWNKQKLAALVQSVMDQLGIKADDYHLAYSKTNDCYRIQGSCQTDKDNITVVTQMVYPIHGKQNCEAYLIINIEKLVAEHQKTTFSKQKITNIFLNTGSSAHINTCLVGWLDGKLEQDNFTARLKTAFKAIDAAVIDKLEQSNFASYNGLSPAINDFLAVDGKRTNVNMAVRYSPYDDRTYITIGSPVITGEY